MKWFYWIILIIVIGIAVYFVFGKTTIQNNKISETSQLTLNLPSYWILNNTNMPVGLMNYIHTNSFIDISVLSGATSEFNNYCNKLLDNALSATVNYKTNSKGINECIVNEKRNPDYSSIFNCPSNLIYIRGFLVNANDVADYNNILDSFVCP